MVQAVAALQHIQFYKLTGHKQKIENAFPARVHSAEREMCEQKGSKMLNRHEIFMIKITFSWCREIKGNLAVEQLSPVCYLFVEGDAVPRSWLNN